MTENEKVVKGLECCLAATKCDICPYNDGNELWCGNNIALLEDALALLKAQEPEAVDAPKPDSDIGCWYDITHNYTLEQVVSALKAQEPRVMTLEEVKQHNNKDGCVWFEQPTYNAVAAFVRKEDFEIEVISPYILGNPINHGYWTNGNYGKTWRCWTSCPTDEQKEEVKWK